MRTDAKRLSSEEAAERIRIGATIRSYREMRGFSPDELASEMGISRPYLANIEAGRKPLTDVLLARLAAALRVRQIAIVHERYFIPEDEVSR